MLPCRWDGVKLLQSFWKLAGLPRISPSQFPNNFPRTSPTVASPPFQGSLNNGFLTMGEKNNKQKTHTHFSDGPCGAIVPGTNPHPSQGQTGQNGNFTVEFNREQPANPVPPKMFMFIGFSLARNSGSRLPPEQNKRLQEVINFNLTS